MSQGACGLRAKGWAMRDSNPHGLRHQILSLACLPISAIARDALHFRIGVAPVARYIEKSGLSVRHLWSACAVTRGPDICAVRSV